jgi:uncharacterized protein YejL (UPF0352 family)
MNMHWSDLLKQQRDAEVSEAVDLFLKIYPDALEVLQARTAEQQRQYLANAPKPDVIAQPKSLIDDVIENIKKLSEDDWKEQERRAKAERFMGPPVIPRKEPPSSLNRLEDFLAEIRKQNEEQRAAGVQFRTAWEQVKLHQKPQALGIPSTLPIQKQVKPFEKKLSDQQVQSIRADLMAGLNRHQIAAKYGISHQAVYAISTGRSRKSVPMSNEFRAWVAQRVATIKRGRGRPKKRK